MVAANYSDTGQMPVFWRVMVLPQDGRPCKTTATAVSNKTIMIHSPEQFSADGVLKLAIEVPAQGLIGKSTYFTTEASVQYTIVARDGFKISLIFLDIPDSFRDFLKQFRKNRMLSMFG
jgi:hypothetical protein